MRPRGPANTHGCSRCGIPTWAEFCRDCRASDPFLTAGGKSARQMTAEARARRQWWEDFMRDIRRVAGYH